MVIRSNLNGTLPAPKPLTALYQPPCKHVMLFAGRLHMLIPAHRALLWSPTMLPCWLAAMLPSYCHECCFFVACLQEDSLAEHFKELMREQSRIQQQITAEAVRAAEGAVMADTAKAHNEERRQRGAAIDELRAKVNALSLAFDQR